MLDFKDLEPEKSYWARRSTGSEIEVVMVSTVFGTTREFWTVAVLGSDQHWALEDFGFVDLSEPPDTAMLDSEIPEGNASGWL